MLQARTIPPCRETRPNVGRKALRPHRLAGEVMEPCVSVPIPKATQAAAVADAGPADDPLDPCSRFHGFRVLPLNHRSPWANSPVESLAMRTAPASRRRWTTSASSSTTWVSKSADPHVVGAPDTENRSFTPHGTPWSGPFQVPALISASACCASSRARPSKIVTAQSRTGSYRFIRSR